MTARQKAAGPKTKAPPVPSIKIRDKIVRWKTGDLKANPRNSRKHSKAQIEQVVESMKRFGWTVPLLIDKSGTLVAGHARLEAAIALGLPEAPAIDVADLTAAERRAYMVADNRLAENATWDWEVLRVEFKELRALGIDLTMTGFTLPDISALMAPAATPGQFKSIDSPNVQYQCPSCGHQWSGKPK